MNYKEKEEEVIIVNHKPNKKMTSKEEQQFDKAAKEILVKLVTNLLMDKPKDPVITTPSIFH